MEILSSAFVLLVFRECFFGSLFSLSNLSEDRSEVPGGSMGRKGTGTFIPGGLGTVAVPTLVGVEQRLGKGPQGPLSVPAPGRSCLQSGYKLLLSSPTKRAQSS